jgi:NAD(P)-dependent dehydrogenase (short-subunit alcohol dehydrogenase family)
MHVIVTGATRGIGKAVTDELDSRNHTWTGISYSMGVDITRYEIVKDIFSYIDGADPPADVLINNAGIVELGSVLELSPENWEKQFAVNLHGVFYCCKEFAKIAKNRGGKIINISSTSGVFTPRPGRSAYAASKAAVISFSLSLAEELRPYGIRVYCIAPGACNTDLRRKIYPDDDFENMMQPEELARFIVDIAEGGEMLDGQVILARGG